MMFIFFFFENFFAVNFEYFLSNCNHLNVQMICMLLVCLKLNAELNLGLNLIYLVDRNDSQFTV